MKKIRLMPDYFCSPIWHNDEIEVGNIDLDELPISNQLKKELLSWADLFDKGLNMDDPSNSYWEEFDYEQFISMGRSLLLKLRTELGFKYQVDYYYD